MPEKMLLAAIATPDYLPQAKQLFASAHEAGYWQGEYMLLTSGISADEREWFETRGILIREYPYTINDDDWNKLYSSRQTGRVFNRVVNERFHLFREEFKQWDIIVYMDCDIIVVGPIIRLAKVKGFMATLDGSPYLKWQSLPEIGPLELSRQGYDVNAAAFCSGMFAFSTDIIEKNTYEKLVELAQRFLPIAKFPNQLISNLFFYKKWQKLSMAYAFALTVMEGVFLQRARGALVLHFADKNRPWEPQSPYNTLWKENLARAEFIDFRTPRNIQWRVQTRAYLKEIFFIPWFFYPKTRFVGRYATKNWFPHLKKIYHMLHHA